MAPLEPYYCEPNNYAPNSESYSSEDSEVDNRWEKIHYTALVKDAKSVASFPLPANFESEGRMSHKHGLVAIYSFKMAASKVSSFEMNFIRI